MPDQQQMIPITQLECPTTKDAIPMCIVSGRHMEAEDWCICPNSNMPALLSQYIEYLESEAKAENVEGAAQAIVESKDTKARASFKAAVRKVVMGSDPVTGKP